MEADPPTNHEAPTTDAAAAAADRRRQELRQAAARLIAALMAFLYRRPVRTRASATSGTKALRTKTETAAATPVPEAEPERLPAAVEDRGNLRGKRVLLLSSDMEDRHGIESHLETWGAVTVKCENAARALHALIEAHDSGKAFHGVIVDHGRAGMDDVQFAHLVRSESSLQGLYLIHIGFYNQSLQRDRLLHAGYTRLLSTPLSKTFLFNALHSTYATPESGDRVVRLIDHVSSRTDRQPLSILAADDEFAARQRLMAMLKKAGHRVFTVNNGARLLDALDSHRFDVALVSGNIREISCLEAFKLYRFTRVDRQWVPFILLYEEGEEALVERCREAGIGVSIERSSEPSAYLEVIDRVAKESLGEGPSTGIGSRTGGGSGTTENSSTLDTNRLMEIERLGGGMRLLSDLIDSFNRDNRRILTQMKQAAEERKVTLFRDLGHALKDGAGSLGTLKLFSLATAATRIREQDFPETAQALVQEITDCCRLSNNALHAYLIDQGASENDNLHD